MERKCRLKDFLISFERISCTQIKGLFLGESSFILEERFKGIEEIKAKSEIEAENILLYRFKASLPNDNIRILEVKGL
jgi:hypothetical protein